MSRNKTKRSLRRRRRTKVIGSPRRAIEPLQVGGVSAESPLRKLSLSQITKKKEMRSMKAELMPPTKTMMTRWQSLARLEKRASRRAAKSLKSLRRRRSKRKTKTCTTRWMTMMSTMMMKSS